MPRTKDTSAATQLKKAKLGAKIRSYRDRTGLTQMEAAKLAGVTREYLASIEIGRIVVMYPEVFNSLHDLLEFPGWEILEEMGYKTDAVAGASARLLPSLIVQASQLDEDQQKGLVEIIKTMVRHSPDDGPQADGSGGSAL